MACASSDVDQVCRPELQSGCSQASFCSITKSGVSVCIANELGRLSEGSLCESFIDESDALTKPEGVCGQGMACIQDGSLARCLTLCDAASDSTQSCQSEFTDGSRHIFGEQSQCVMRVADRPEIGVCRLPCQFGLSGDAAGCPEDTTCGLLADDRKAQCLPDGEMLVSGACGPNCMCSSGLVCVPEAYGSVCRSSVTVSGCGDTHFLGEVEGSVDELSQSSDAQPYAYCTRCIALLIAEREAPIWLCAGAEGCEGTKTLANLEAVNLSQLATSVSTRLGDVFQVVVGLEQRDQEWYWPGSSMAQATTGGDVPADCPTMDAQGNLIIESMCPEMSVCEALDTVQCGFAMELGN